MRKSLWISFGRTPSGFRWVAAQKPDGIKACLQPILVGGGEQV